MHAEFLVVGDGFSVKSSLFLDMKNLIRGVYQDRRYESRCYLHALHNLTHQVINIEFL